MHKKIIKRRELMHNDFQPEAMHPLLKRIYAIRGIRHLNEIERSLENLLPYHQLLNIDAAAVLLADALETSQRLLIVGDFDADGATSTALAMRCLKNFGAPSVNFLVPNRFSFGYGLTPELVAVAKQEFSPDIIITVDNGIANNPGVDEANRLGIKVLITDHHLPGAQLPNAAVIVNPNQPGDPFPSKNLAGVGVIFYVMLALRKELITREWFAKKNIAAPNMSSLLDLVALGTVADVVPLDQNNRILVYQGLRRIRAGHCAPGITALLEAANRQPYKLVSADLGFAVAPRLNAAGRLDDMSLGIHCLLSEDIQQAREMAYLLSELNDERRGIEQEMQTQALKIIQELPKLATDKLPTGLCLFDENWHQGVIGIVASRMKDRFHRPVIAFALANENDIKGSARSIPGLHIRDALAHIDAKYPKLIDKFGGHAMAAGLSLSRKVFTDFAKIFDEVVSSIVREEHLQHHLYSDGELHEHELCLDTAETLREAGPWGQSFPEPVFDGTFDVLDQRLVGSKHLKLTLGKNDFPIDAIAFNVDVSVWPNYRCSRVHIAYRLDINEFRGRKTVQLIIEDIEALL